VGDARNLTPRTMAFWGLFKFICIISFKFIDFKLIYTDKFTLVAGCIFGA